MKENSKFIPVIIVIVLLIIGVASVLALRPDDTDVIIDNEPVPTETNQPQGKLMDIETYVRANISEISPVKEQLGGTFYVTKIETNDGVGVVEYEDGHNAYVADFTYTMSDLEGIKFPTFVIREQPAASPKVE